MKFLFVMFIISVLLLLKYYKGLIVNDFKEELSNLKFLSIAYKIALDIY